MKNYLEDKADLIERRIAGLEAIIEECNKMIDEHSRELLEVEHYLTHIVEEDTHGELSPARTVPELRIAG